MVWLQCLALILLASSPARADAPLADAAERGDRAAVRSLLASGIDAQPTPAGRDDGPALGGPARRPANGRAPDRREGRREGREPLRRDAPVARLRQRQRGDGRAAPQGRRRRERPAARRPRRP